MKQSVQRIFPGLYNFLRFKIGQPAQYNRISSAVTDKYGKTVQEGPFKGMTYIDNAAGSAYIPKILGCYEMEIGPLVEKIIERQYPVIIDVGCAEGYYAVGLAVRCPNSQVYAFDIDENAQKLCQELAQANGVQERVKVGGLCDAETLESLGSKEALLVCDIEGYEMDLIDPVRSPALKNMDILVEFHDFLRPNATKTILERLKATHTITIMDAVKRVSEQHPLVKFLNSKDQVIALEENRHEGQQFAFFQAKSAT